MFERYSESARRALFFARYEAGLANSWSISSEHLLLGLLHEPGGLAPLLRVPPERLRVALRNRSSFSDKTPHSVEIPFSAEIQRALSWAVDEADALHHDFISSEHLLLGLLHDEHSAAASVLAAEGIRLSDMRRDVAKLLEPPKVSPGATAPPDITRHIDQIKALVEELARAVPESAHATTLVGRIGALLDALPGGDKIR